MPAARRALTALLALGLACGSPSSEPEGALAEDLDDHLEAAVQDGELSGMVLVGHADKGIRAVRSYGWADFEAFEPHGGSTRFRIASLTKTITAAAVGILLQRGELALEDPVSRYLPDFEPAERITIRHLLRHESGLGAPEYSESFETSVDLEGLVERITGQPLQFEPGTESRYSNAGYNVLAYVVQEAAGAPYEEFLQREIFEPAGMARTGTELSPQNAPHHARGYTPGPGGPRRVRMGDIGFALGSGHLSSTVEDLFRWGVAVHENRFVDLDAQIARDWPYGWGKIEIGELRGVEQTGAVQGYVSSLAVFDDGTIVVMLLNIENGRWTSIAKDLAAIALGEAVKPIPRRETASPSSAALSLYPGTYRGDDRTLEVRNEDGHLWLYSSGWPVGKYLLPLAPAGDGRFAVPADWGEVRIQEGDLVWDFGDQETVYRRLVD